MKNIADVTALCERLRQGLDSVVIGQQALKDRLLVCLLAGGHLLIEGVPGTGKTLLALTASRLVGGRFRRIQFTPDLMPVDLVGTNVFNEKTHEFEFREGPLFADFLLADEINRTPPRTQSALLEAMQERAATVDGVRHEISPVFTVIATQNPVEFEGTYPLPEAQKDRFLLKAIVDYPKPDEEETMLGAYAAGRRLHDEVVQALTPVTTVDELRAARRLVASGIRVEANLLGYIRRIAGGTREDETLQIGAGPRASLALLESSRALAALRGRDFVTPDDVKEVGGPVLAHRVVLSPEAEMEGTMLDDVVRRLFERVEVPR